MFARSRMMILVSLLAFGGLLVHSDGRAESKDLCVCADPNNLPFSNSRGEGFENVLARMVARDLHRHLRYFWWAERRGFIRSTLSAHECDLVMGIPVGFEKARATMPYYRSSYVFITRRDRHLALRSLDDPALASLRIGAHVIGADNASLPPVQELTRRGLGGNIVGYTIYGDYSKPNPPARLLDEVARGDVDVAVAWGPLAGYFARRASAPLDVTPIASGHEPNAAPMSFEIAMGVRKDEPELKSALDRVIENRRGEIRALLERYGVPLTEERP
jgi:mxaJ protein